MKSYTHCLSTCALHTLLVILVSYGLGYGQTEDPFQLNNFDEGMGIWSQSQSASIIPVSANDNQKWLLLQKGIGSEGEEADQDPFIATEALQLGGSCGVTVTFDLFALNASEDEIIYLEVSSDNGKTFKMLRESQEESFLKSGKSFVNGAKSRFSYPLRSFVSDQIVLRLSTKNMRSESQFFLDNLNLISSQNEDYLLAEWQMGQVEGTTSALMPEFDAGNCSGVFAHPLSLDSEGSHIGVEGYTYELLEDSPVVQSSKLNNGGLCIDIQNKIDPLSSNKLTFTIDLVPAEKGIISGFEFMEKAPVQLNGTANDYPKTFSLEIFKEGELLFSQTNIPTSREWSDRTFRLQHIKEFLTSTAAQYTFVLTPQVNAGSRGELAVWLIDEVKILGGCCDLDCEFIEVNILTEKTEEGLLLTPSIDGDYDCLAVCQGQISNEGAEVVSKLDNQSTGWSYFNAASTIENTESTIALPENFEAHSFMLSSRNSIAAPYLETDIINLCPDEVYSVCFDHLKSSAGNSSSKRNGGLCVWVDGKCKYIASGTEAKQTCMSFTASNSNHKLQLSVDKRFFSSRNDNVYYLDNVLVDHLPAEQEMELPVDWKDSDNIIYKTEVPEVDLNLDYSFTITSALDTSSTYKKNKLYTLCFKAELNDDTEFNQLNLQIDSEIEKQVNLDNMLADYCIDFFSDKRVHELAFSQVNNQGEKVYPSSITMQNLVVRSNILSELSEVEPKGIRWTLPDGTQTSDFEVLVDQNGDYDLEFTNCHQCSVHEEFTSEIDFSVCPEDLKVDCSESLNPDINALLRLHQPQAPYSIGYFYYEDELPSTSCVGEFSRLWTVERRYKDEVLDTTYCHQVIAVKDNEKPQLGDFADILLSCKDELPEPENFGVIDNCSRKISLSSEDIEYKGTGCAESPIVISRYWTATDACGNTITKPQNFVIVYDVPKVTCPPSLSVVCEADIVPGMPEVTWSCEELESSYVIELSLSEGTDGCSGSVYDMTYNVEDVCGRNTTCIQQFYLEGQTLELSCPAAVTVSCVSDFEYGTPTHTVSCGTEIALSFSDLELANGEIDCDGAEYLVKYTGETNCGLSASCIQSVFVSNSGISIFCPTDEEVICPEDIVSGTALIQQACNLQYYSHHTTPYLVSGIADCSDAVYEIEYTAEDDCGNEAACIQEFTIVNTGMTISCPPDLTVECFTHIQASLPELFSFCFSEPDFSFSDPLPLNTDFSCDQEVYEIEYSGTNSCGDEVSCFQLFTLSNDGLSIVCPADQVVSCYDDIEVGEPSVMSACDVYYSVSNSTPILETGYDGCPQSTYSILYDLSDDCGNFTSCMQTFVLDSPDLSLECPADKVVTQFEDVEPDAIEINQPCGLAFELSTQVNLSIIDCNQATYVVTYSVENVCSEFVYCDQMIVLTDEENAINSDFICANTELFIGLDCDQGGVDDIDECNNGTDLDYPCDDVNIEIEPMDALCFGTSTGEINILTVNGNPPYEFSTDNNLWIQTPYFGNLPAGTYTVYIRSTYGPECNFSEEVIISEPHLTEAEAGDDQEICIGLMAELGATGGDSYAWSTGDQTQNISVSPSVTTTYTVTVTQSDGCYNIDEVTVIVNENNAATTSADQEICIGYSADLTADGGVAYLWSTGDESSDLTVTPSQSTIYTVTVTDANGCTDIAETTVNVNPSPDGSAGEDQSLCLGDEATLTASGGSSYEWSTGSNEVTFVVAPTVTSTYNVTVTDEKGCTSIDEVTIVVNFNDQADAGPDQALCTGQSTSLTATGGTSYVWSTGETTSTISLTPSQTTSYAVTVTDDNGCTDTADVEVVVHDIPVAQITGDEVICIAHSSTLSASGGINYLWSTGETTAEVTVSPSTTTIYFVTVTDVNGCTDMAEKEVIVHSNDSADAGFDEELCIGEEVELEATGGDIFTWSTGETTSTIMVAPSTTTTYAVTTTDTNGCTDVATVAVTVHPLPIADAGPDQAICLGDNAVLVATGGTEYLWSNGYTDITISVSPDTSAVYAVTVTDVNGCTAVDQVEVIVNPLPLAETNDAEICLGDSSDLVASGGLSYLWSSGETTEVITVSPTVTTSYIVTVTDGLGCSDLDTAEVIVHELPLADAGNDKNICIGTETTLIATGGVSYLWSTGEVSDSITVSPNLDYSYFVTVTDSYGCTSQDEVQVFVHEYPNADAGSWAVACGAEGAMLTATGGTNYLWSTGDTTAVVTVYPSSYQVYSVTVSNNYGCSDVEEVHVFTVPAPPVDAGPDIVICPGDYALLYGYGGDEYLWEPNLYLDTNTGPFVVSTPDSTITYTLTVTDESGCTASDQVTVTVEEDTTPPYAQCWDIVVYTDENGQATISPFDVDDESSDNCTPVDLELDETTFSCLLKDYTVTLTVTDYYGNSSTCQSIVTLAGPDNDCDFMVNGCDLCEGGDDTVDVDGDGFPDCAYPPASYTDVEDLWKCDSGNNVEEVWVCHSPNQSICIDYAEVYTHVSYHQDDYLGPCHAVGCYSDREVNVQDVLDDLEAYHHELKISCPPTVLLINDLQSELLEELKAAVVIEEIHCDLESISFDLSEEALINQLYLGEAVELAFQVKDHCGNSENCRSLVKAKQQNLGLFPNPTNEWLNISGLENESYVIYNAKGERVTVVNYAEILNVSYLDEGIYLLVTNSGRSSRFVISGIR